VFGDWGDTRSNGVNDGSLNADQAAVLARIGASGGRFALSTGDIGYPVGTQTNYGDLNQTGVNVSGVFGPSYWADPGQRMPMYTVAGNHGRTGTLLTNWPQSAVTAASGGTYRMVSYPADDGRTAVSYPTTYYAFSTGRVRFYMLDASWAETNVGTASGGACGSRCAAYEVDRDVHWTPDAPEYRWLAQDLAAHPGGLKMAVFHYPPRSDSPTEPDDGFLQNTPRQYRQPGTTVAGQRGAARVQRPRPHVPAQPRSRRRHRQLRHRRRRCEAHAVGRAWLRRDGCVRYRLVLHVGEGFAMWIGAGPDRRRAGLPLPEGDVNGTRVTVEPTDSTGHTFDVRTYDFP
jgi:hypothetical protein